MKTLLRIILALLLTPAHLLADENVKLKDENEDQELANLNNQIKDEESNHVNNMAAQSLFSKPV